MLYTHTPITTFLIYHIFKVRFPVSFIVMRNEIIVEMCVNPLNRIILHPHLKINKRKKERKLLNMYDEQKEKKKRRKETRDCFNYNTVGFD